MKLTEEQRALVEQNLGLVNVHIRRFVALPRSPHRQREYDDLYQEGCLSLMESAKTHDPARHGPFAAYAIPRIHHAISMALYERFSTVRVPAKSVKRARQRQRDRAGDDRHRPEPALVETHNFSDESMDARVSTRSRPCPPGACRAAGGEGIIRARLREKYQAAVREAADRVCASGRGREDRHALIKRFVEERLLIPEPGAQTSKRQLARDFSCSIGRVQSCDDALTGEIRGLLGADDEFRALLHLARQEDEGMDAPVEASAGAKLTRAALDGFARRFARLPAGVQADVLRNLVCTVLGSLSDFARRLFGQLDVRQRAHFLGAVLGDGAEPAKTREGKHKGRAR